MFLKIYGTETALTSTPTTLGNAQYVRLTVHGNDPHLVTIKDSSAVVIGTFSILQAQEFLLKKNPTDTIELTNGTDIKAVKVGIGAS